ncbi:ABC transporter ATP-binding protein [Desulforhopalus sp. 52FAK]
MLNYRLIYYYFTVYKKYIGKRLYIVFVLSALAAVTESFGISLLLPLIELADIGLASDEVSDDNVVLKGLWILLDYLGIGSSMVSVLFFIAFIFLSKGVIAFVSNAYQSHLKAQLLHEIKSLVFDLYNKMDYGYYSSYNTGHFVNIVNGQVDKLIASFDSYKQFLTTIVTALAYLMTAALLAWKFALMALVAGVGLLLLFRGLNVYVHRLSKQTAYEQGNLNKFLVQTIQSFKYLTSTAQLDFLRTEVMASVSRLSVYMRNQGIAQSLTTALNEPISIVFILIVIIIQVSVLDASLAPIFVALVLFNRAMGSILGIQGAWQSTMSKIGALEVVEAEIKKLKDNNEVNGINKVKPFEKKIELSNVCFSYDQEHGNVLDDITFTIRANSTVAFVGESGSGKSTLVDMLTLLLKPNHGDILIDGVSSRDIDLDSWRRQIGYVSQETVVFDDTVANNICLWKGDCNLDSTLREKVENACTQAYAEQFIQDLPEKFNTLVGDRGVRLSGGQRQRLFLARELFKKPRLLILDEATSALDSESEHYIQESIEDLRGKTTVIIIAHRLSTIKNADYIYVLSKGKIVEHGKYLELLADSSSSFSKMISLQTL